MRSRQSSQQAFQRAPIVICALLLWSLSLMPLFGAWTEALGAPAREGESAGRSARQLPSEVLDELRALQVRFREALSGDCDRAHCFPKGCTYQSHEVVDRPSAGALPGLRIRGEVAETEAQIYLTRAQCAFAYESSIKRRDLRALRQRLEAKLSQGGLKVSVVTTRLRAISPELREPPDDELPEGLSPAELADTPPAEPTASEEIEPEETPPTQWERERAILELWETLLPHFAWMIALLLLTLTGLLLIWGIRRLGQRSVEEELLLAQLLREEAAEASVGEALSEQGDPIRDQEVAAAEATRAAEDRRARRLESWRLRFSGRAEGPPDPTLQAMVSDLLRRGEHRLLAKAVSRFPSLIPMAFPEEGGFSAAKLQLADFVRAATPAQLPSDDELLDTLDRYALAATLSAQADTALLRSLHEEFGAAAIATLVVELPPRYGALLFAHCAPLTQREALGRIAPSLRGQLAAMLLCSNRIDEREHNYLLTLLGALRAGDSPPKPPSGAAVSDRGAEYEAAAALSRLLPSLSPEARAAAVEEAERHLAGTLSGWCDAILYGELLLELPRETRIELFLEIEPGTLAAWLRGESDASRVALQAALPESLRRSIEAAPIPLEGEALAALGDEGRRGLVRGLQRRRRAGMPVPMTRELLA